MSSVRQSWDRKRAALGFLASVIVLVLFANLQNTSDLAPAAIKSSETPGILGAPVAILSVLWFIVIAGMFIKGVRRNALGMKGFVLPQPFISGAFLGLLVGLPILQTWFPF